MAAAPIDTAESDGSRLGVTGVDSGRRPTRPVAFLSLVGRAIAILLMVIASVTPMEAASDWSIELRAATVSTSTGSHDPFAPTTAYAEAADDVAEGQHALREPAGIRDARNASVIPPTRTASLSRTELCLPERPPRGA